MPPPTTAMSCSSADTGPEVSRTTLDSRTVQSGNGKRVLVTGAAGFIGSHVADGCLELGMEVVATDDLSGGFRENVPDGAEWIEGDLRDAAFVASLWDGGRFDYVYHLGAYAAEGLSHFIRAYNYRTNLEASVNLINQAVQGDVERFVFTSSIAVYGAGQVPMSEIDGPGAGGPVRDLEVRGGARPRRGAQHVRPRLHGVPASQRLRRAPEHRATVTAT